MTEKQQEFIKFLESIDGVFDDSRRSVYANQPITTDFRYHISIGDGWLPLLKSCMDDLLKVGWDRRFFQIKEKFGGLRFYLSEYNDELSKIIDFYERESVKICEVCGQKGEKRTDISWYKTLCDEHYRETKNKN